MLFRSAGMNQKKARSDDEIQIIDDPIKQVAVEPGNHFLHASGARQRAIGRIDDDRQSHQKKRFAKRTLFDSEDTKEADDGAEGGIKMDEPGEDQTPGHPADLRRGSGEAGPALEPIDPGGGLAVFAGIDWDSKSL